MAETDAQKSRRRNRMDARGEPGELVAYEEEGGQSLIWTGDDEAPYVKVVNGENDPVVITPVATAPIIFYLGSGSQQEQIYELGPVHVRQVRAILEAAVVTDRFLMIFDSAVAVSNGDTPVWQALVPGGLTTVTTHAEAGDDFEPIGGLPLTSGFTIAISTTPGTLTLPGLADTYFEASYTIDQQ